MFLKRFFLSLLLLLCFNISHASEDFKVKLESSKDYALLTIDLAPGVKTYWRNPGEIGLPTVFTFEASENLKKAEILWPIPQIYTEHGVTSYIYQNRISFPIKIEAIDKTKDILLKLKADFTTCSHTCDSHELFLFANIAPNAPISEEITKLLAKIPNNKNIHFISTEQKVEGDQHWLEIKFAYPNEVRNPKLYIDLPEYASFDPLNYIISKDADGYLLNIPFSLRKPKQNIDYAYINLQLDKNYAEYTYILSADNEIHSLFFIILYALIGGLILNIMPCVLPVLALKFLQLAKLSGKDLKAIRYDLIGQSLGIIASFIVLGFITFYLRSFGIQAGLGMSFQQPIYLITMTLILGLIAMNLLSRSEIYLPIPRFLIDIIPQRKQGMLGFFFAGVLATMLATPCTAPFITVAASFALTAEFNNMMIIFIAIGLGMSLPYIIVAIWPKIAKLLPKPGLWMEKFRKFLGILILLTCIWIIYIVSTQMSAKAALVLFFLLVLIKFVLSENSLKKWIKIAIFLVLTSLAYILPFNLHINTNLEKQIEDQVWQEYRPEMITQFIEEGHLVLVDITASWCATCNINKFTSLNNQTVMNFMKKHNVIGMRASVNKTGDNSPQILSLMRMHKHYGVPLNIIYSSKNPNGIILPTILLPSVLINAIKEEF